MKLEVLSIVFVDIKGYTTMTSNQSRLFNERLLARFSALIKPMARVFNGTVVKSLGDAYLLTFKSPTDSLLCAMAVQDELANRAGHWPEGEQFEVRFAINAGEVRVEKKDVFGEAVNVAARIEGLAEGGEIYFSEAVYLIMNRNEVPAKELGLKKLKGVADEVRVYKVPRGKEAAALGPYQAFAAKGPAPAWAQALPYSGLGLAKFRTHTTGRGVDAEGALRLRGALSEVLYGTNSRTRGFLSRGWWAWLLVLVYYPLSLVLSALGFVLSPRFFAAAWVRFKKTLGLLWDSPSYRRKALTALLSMAAVVGSGWWAWTQYVEAEKAKERAAELKQMMEQKEELVRKKDAELKKERNRFKFPWQKKE